MHISIYKILDLNNLITTEISFQIAVKTTAIPVGVCEDVAIVVANVMMLTDFVILGRVFLNNVGVVIVSNKSKATLHVNGNEHTIYFLRKPNKGISLNSIDIL